MEMKNISYEYLVEDGPARVNSRCKGPEATVFAMF